MNWILILVLSAADGGASMQSIQGFQSKDMCQHSINELVLIDDRKEILIASCRKQGV